eukprot:Nk52_evm1s35 gene=Nk52_evmTU1s35
MSKLVTILPGSCRQAVLLTKHHQHLHLHQISMTLVPRLMSGLRGFGSSSMGGHSKDVVKGANIYVTGSDPEIKPDSEYPEWVWSLADPPKTKDDFDPVTDKRYWKKLKKEQLRKKNLLRKK